MNWISFPDEQLPVYGLAWWMESSPRLIRMPERLKERVRPEIWGLCQAPSGGRIRFATDASALGLRVCYPDLNYMNNMPRTGHLGVDLYVDDDYWRTVYPTETAEVEQVVFEDLPGEWREICLYLPLYGAIEVQAIGLSEDAGVEAPEPFAADKPVVYYGSSITQGGCATRSSMSYQAILGRMLNLDFVNLGFSGNGLGEPEVAAAVAEIDASCFVMDFIANCPDAAYGERVYAPFLQVLRDEHPETPIICCTPNFMTPEDWNPATPLPAMREVIRRAYRDRVAAGDQHITLVEGYDMLGPDDREGLCDGVHPNDLGFQAMAAGLVGAVERAVLGG